MRYSNHSKRHGSKRKEFLLVEDEPADVLFVRMAFEDSGHGLHIATDGREAMDYLGGVGEFADRAKHPLPDVVLLDIKMPRVGGFEFLDWLRHKAPPELHALPVIIMSSSDDPGDIRRAYEMGVNAYLTKPVPWEDFRERMKTLNIFWGNHAETPPVPS
jgi:CheY-like chemotaxis protein